MSICTRLPRRLQCAGVALLVLALMLGWSTVAMAAEAYIQNGAGAREKALAGAGVASSTDATAAGLNPAGLVNVGNQLNASISFLHLDGGYTAPPGIGINAEGHHDSETGWLPIPNLAVNWRVNSPLVDAIAFTAYGNGGVSTHYKDVANDANCPPGLSGVFCGGPLGITMSQSFYSVAFAKEISRGLSIGVAPILAHQQLKVEGGSLFPALLPTIDPTAFSNNGTDHAWGASLRGGLEWKIAPGLRVGVAGHPRIFMTKFERYRGLLPEQGDLDIPATLQAGVAYDVTPILTLMADYKRIWFSSVAALHNPSTNAPPFGADAGPGFGVQDVDVIKFGLEWRRSPKLTLRAGYSYNTAPIKSRDADINIITLGVVQHHITGGLKYQLTQNWDLELAAMYAPKASVSGTELFVPPRSVEIEMSQFEFTVGAVYRFGM
jgi:long-chain fatty acid transport protein